MCVMKIKKERYLGGGVIVFNIVVLGRLRFDILRLLIEEEVVYGGGVIYFFIL